MAERFLAKPKIVHYLTVPMPRGLLTEVYRVARREGVRLADLGREALARECDRRDRTYQIAKTKRSKAGRARARLGTMRAIRKRKAKKEATNVQETG